MGFLPNLFTMPGSSAMNTAMQAQNALAGQMSGMYQQYAPQIYAALWQQYNNPDSTAQQSQWNNLQASTLRQYQTAGQNLQRSLVDRGLGQSSMTQNNLGALWNAFGNTMANARAQYLTNQDQQRQQALSSLGSYLMSNANGAMNAYNTAYNMGQQQGNEFANNLKGLATNIGTYGLFAV